MKRKKLGRKGPWTRELLRHFYSLLPVCSILLPVVFVPTDLLTLIQTHFFYFFCSSKAASSVSSQLGHRVIWALSHTINHTSSSRFMPGFQLLFWSQNESVENMQKISPFRSCDAVVCSRVFTIVCQCFACIPRTEITWDWEWGAKQGDIALQATTVWRMETKFCPFFSLSAVSVLLSLLLCNPSLSVC